MPACSVNTPTKTRGVGAGKAADLTYWEGAARVIASVSTSSKIIVEKSTVPVKTAEAIEKVGDNCLWAVAATDRHVVFGGVLGLLSSGRVVKSFGVLWCRNICRPSAAALPRICG